jgi:hypothetical protein
MIGPANYNIESHDKGLIGNGLSYIKGFSTKVKTGILIGIAAGGIAAGAILAGGGPSGSNDNAPFVNPTPTLETYVTATPLPTNTPTNTPTPEPTSTPDLETLYYEIGKGGSLTQIYASTNDIIEFAKKTKNEEEAEKRFRTLVFGIAADGFNVDKLVEVHIACYEHREGLMANKEDRLNSKEANLISLEREKEDPLHLRVYGWSNFINCLY